ncbi:hypothetical protein CEXT_100641 [Caerostris extrusa]|uniref:Uncharacterized protein n=1 Tax=Caerostris extrusa TaxID=172846 RepID=A0AAV4MAA3_CAEEX|nr:hypothetical protein CEXT_100641 [Caerostris extrusa]
MPKPCRYSNDRRNQRKQKDTLSKEYRREALELSALVVCVIHHLGLSRGSLCNVIDHVNVPAQHHTPMRRGFVVKLSCLRLKMI